MSDRRRLTTAGVRTAVAGAGGVVTGVVVGLTLGWVVAPVAGWLVAAAIYLATTWLAVGRMNAERTARFATREDPTVPTTNLLLVLASLASLGGVALLLASADTGHKLLASLLGVASVAASWLTVHTLFTLGYAARYYTGSDGGIDFNQKAPPAYLDFAYLGFTIGMTYQVSDTTVGDPYIRRMVLRHALLSYLLGAVVLAISINLVAGLAH